MGRSGKQDQKTSQRRRRLRVVRSGGRALQALWQRVRRTLPRAVRSALILSIAGMVLMGSHPGASPLPDGWPLAPGSREVVGSDDLGGDRVAGSRTRLSVRQVAMAWPEPPGAALRLREPGWEPITSRRSSGPAAPAAKPTFGPASGQGAPSPPGVLPAGAIEVAGDRDQGSRVLRARPSFRAPVEGVAEGAFGWHRHDQYEDWRFRNGLAFRLESGASPVVRAALAGRVTRVGTPVEDYNGAVSTNTAASSLAVRVEHAGGWETRYVGLSEVYVREGDRVATRSTLGRMRTGGAVRLEFSIFHLGEAVDPGPLLTP